MSTVAVIGGAGRVGFGLCLVLANAGHSVTSIDINEITNDRIRSGEVPFVEPQAGPHLQNALANGRLKIVSTPESIDQTEVLIVVTDTSMDSAFNPRADEFGHLITPLIPHLQRGQLIVLRSTLKPGTTEVIKTLIEESRNWRCGSDFDLVVAPERMLQGKAIEEIGSFPQLIGAFDDLGYDRALEFFSTFSLKGCIRLSPIEAELSKLIANMARYVNFAFANEVHLIADLYGANAHRMIDAVNQDFDRANIPSPGPNTRGPCLFKDGHFLIEDIPFADLVSVSLKINEGMPSHIVAKIKAIPSIRKAIILGMTYKADNDDTRDSLSFKLQKQLKGAGYDVACVDPYLPEYRDPTVLKGTDCAVLMTPHALFSDLPALAAQIDNPACWMIDVWGFWRDMRYRSENGLFTLADVSHSMEAALASTGTST